MRLGKILLTGAVLAGMSGALLECKTPNSQKLNTQQIHNNLIKTLTIHEGKRNWVYDDKTGKRLYPGDKCSKNGRRTIGVGLNLTGNPSAKRLIKSLERNYSKIFNGETNLTDSEISYLLDHTIYNAVRDAEKFVSKAEYDNLDSRAQEVLVNMSFCMGGARLSGFNRFKQALKTNDYNWAAFEIKDSNFYRGSHNKRAKQLADKMSSIESNYDLKLRPWVKNLAKDIKYRIKN